MRFPAQTPLPFTDDGIRQIGEGQTGCYGLQQLSGGRVAWIYVGKATDLRARLLEHLHKDSRCVNLYWPTHFLTVVSPSPDALEKQLIIEYGPVCNAKVG